MRGKTKRVKCGRMIYLAYISFILTGGQLLVALANLFYRQSFPVESGSFGRLVSVLIPARNEERNIAFILDDLQKQNYRNIEILVFDDLSSDSTGKIVSGRSKPDSRIRLIRSGGLPEGWLGKNYACHVLSGYASGDYLLYLDADVRLKKDGITNAVDLSEKYGLGLLSIFPSQIMVTTGERIAVPVMNYILLSLLPLFLVRKTGFKSLAAANGQFMLFKASKYRELMPHKKVRGKRVEDIEIARYFKEKGVKIDCLTGNDDVSCRMYKSFGEAANGFSRNVTTFFGNSFLFSFLFWMITTLGFIPVYLVLGTSVFALYITAIILTRVIISVVSRQNIMFNLLYHIPQQLALGYFVYKALVNKYKKQHRWKGRLIP